MNAVVPVSDLVQALAQISSVVLPGLRKKDRDSAEMSIRVDGPEFIVEMGYEPTWGGLTCSEGDRYTLRSHIPCFSTPASATVPVTVSFHSMRHALQQFDLWDVVQMEIPDGSSTLRMSRRTDVAFAVNLKRVAPQIPQISSDLRQVRLGISELRELALPTRIIGREKFQPEFLQWILDFRNAAAVSMCGEGGMFRAIERRDIVCGVGPGEASRHIIHTTQLEPTLRLLRSLKDEEWCDIRDDGQVMELKIGNVSLLLHREEHHQKYPPLIDALNGGSPRRWYVCDSTAFREAANALESAPELPKLRSELRVHVTDLSFGEDNSTLTLSTRAQSVSVSMPIIAAQVDDNSTTTGPEVATLPTPIIWEIASAAKAYGFVQLGIIGQTTKPIKVVFSNQPQVCPTPWMPDTKNGGFRRDRMMVAQYVTGNA